MFGEYLIEKKLKDESIKFREVESGELRVGEFYPVKILRAEEFDLYGEII